MQTIAAANVHAEHTTPAGWLNDTAVSTFYSHSGSSDSYLFGIDKRFENGFTGAADIALEHVTTGDQESARSFSLELIKEMNNTWLLSGVINQWNGADAVESATVEFELSRLFNRHRLGVFVAKHDYHLTGTRLNGETLERDFDAESAGAEIRIYPTDALEISLRYRGYSHDFNPESLNVEQRPVLLLLLSPDTVGVLSGLIDRSISLDANLYRGRWLLGAQAATYKSAVDRLETRSVTIYADYELTTHLSLSTEIGQQATKTYSATEFLGIGARFTW